MADGSPTSFSTEGMLNDNKKAARSQPCGNGAPTPSSPVLPSFDEQLRQLDAILKASPGYGKVSVSPFVSEPEPEDDPDNQEPTAMELRATERPWGL